MITDKISRRKCNEGREPLIHPNAQNAKQNRIQTQLPNYIALQANMAGRGGGGEGGDGGLRIQYYYP